MAAEEFSDKQIMKKIFFVISLFLSLVCASFADDVFKLDLMKDGIITGSGLLLNGSDYLLNDIFHVNKQVWDGTPYNKDEVNGLDRLFMKPYNKDISFVSDRFLETMKVVPFVLPVFEYFGGNRNQSFPLAVMYVEASVINNSVTNLIKMAVVRARPYMYFDSSYEKGIESGDWANSFPSGHTSQVFTAAAFLSYTFGKLHPDSPFKIPVYVTAFGLAMTTGILRMESGFHFFTDVVTGALIGTSIGILVPWLHTIDFGTKNLDVNLSPLGVGFTMSL